ncbi:hypothetical protein PS467_15870 [Streptomyces luomodiensis]|uniref:Uncharacterized protein n=1 Tax=Streptomyces luomodiensis TaxID=3026192 RepID=A0ABY9UW04_9ACTN|nr:hypothetical protein [Streptomyces sp. SCA4-21]WNE96703.1 hypothetical protein PS467_15870 [Streptomyces sp. SCA4-21]
MAMENMQGGRCSACRGDEVYEIELAGQFGMRKPGGLVSKHTVFNAFVCAGCGHMQWHAAMDEVKRDWLRRRGRRIRPQPPNPPGPPQPPNPPRPQRPPGPPPPPR